MNTSEEASPPLAELCRRLLESTGKGMLATQSAKHPGYPFASVTPFAADEKGRPLFLFSSMATHSKNIRADSKVTLLVTPESAEDGPFAASRASIIGDVIPVPSVECEDAKSIYLARHPEAQQWVSFGDFKFYRLNIVDVYFVAGFGAMGWIAPEQFESRN